MGSGRNVQRGSRGKCKVLTRQPTGKCEPVTAHPRPPTALCRGWEHVRNASSYLNKDSFQQRNLVENLSGADDSPPYHFKLRASLTPIIFSGADGPAAARCRQIILRWLEIKPINLPPGQNCNAHRAGSQYVAQRLDHSVFILVGSMDRTWPDGGGLTSHRNGGDTVRLHFGQLFLSSGSEFG